VYSKREKKLTVLPMDIFTKDGQTNQLGKNHIPEIQGLRGIAVLLVVFFHSDEFLPGGFIGVDVFFVISGFVITKLLIREINSRQPSMIRRFFLGRFYRLFPASSVVVLFTLLFAALALSPIDGIQDVTAVSRYASLFAGNFGLLQSGGYFFSSNPLEHLWSLGVEAQFYVAYPFIFLFLFRYSRRWKHSELAMALMIVGMMFASLFFATVIARQVSRVFMISARDFSFYMMPSRSWEFLLGALVAIVPDSRKAKRSTSKSYVLLASVAVIAISAIFFNRQNSFPGFFSLLPAVGSALVVGFYNQSLAVAAVLRSRLLVFFGNVSYSWYLWHWPLIVFSSALFPNVRYIALVIGFASLLPAWLSYLYIEKRIRFKSAFKIKQITLIALCSIALPMLASFAIDGIRLSLLNHIDDAPALVDNRFSVVNQCQHVVQLESDKCFKKSVESRNLLVLFGDSHASSASDGVVAAANKTGSDIGVVSFDGCPPFSVSDSGDGCSNARITYEQTLAAINPDTVVLVNSLEHYLQYDGNKNEDSAYIVNSLANYVHSLVSNRIRVIVILQVPNMEIGGQVSILRPRLSTTRSNLKDQETRASLLRQLREEIGIDPLVTLVDTDEIFCKDDLCYPRINGELIYRDPSHLNQLGSMLLVAPLTNALKP
jgi:peptidoglycan/LPS O-acetylase OafA/YrhL